MRHCKLHWTFWWVLPWSVPAVELLVTTFPYDKVSMSAMGGGSPFHARPQSTRASRSIHYDQNIPEHCARVFWNVHGYRYAEKQSRCNPSALHHVYGSCRPRPLAQLRQRAGVSMAHSTALPRRPHGCRFLHQRTPTPWGRSLRRQRQRLFVCLQQVYHRRGHSLPRLRRAVAHFLSHQNSRTDGVSPHCLRRSSSPT